MDGADGGGKGPAGDESSFAAGSVFGTVLGVCITLVISSLWSDYTSGYSAGGRLGGAASGRSTTGSMGMGNGGTITTHQHLPAPLVRQHHPPYF